MSDKLRESASASASAGNGWRLGMWGERHALLRDLDIGQDVIQFDEAEFVYWRIFDEKRRLSAAIKGTDAVRLAPEHREAILRFTRQQLKLRVRAIVRVLRAGADSLEAGEFVKADQLDDSRWWQARDLAEQIEEIEQDGAEPSGEAKSSNPKAVS